MGRIAGDNPGYTFRLCRTLDSDLDPSGKYVVPTEHGFDLRSVTTIIDNTVGKPFGAGAWWGFRVGLEGMVEIHPDMQDHSYTAEELEAELKEAGVSPNIAVDEAGDRGRAAHECLELCMKDDFDGALDIADEEFGTRGTHYGHGVVDWAMRQADWTFESEVPVWSLAWRYAGTADLVGHHKDGRLEVVDLKTHKPARGFTKRGAAYLSDVVQCRAYREALEEMRGIRTNGQLVLVVRETGEWLEDRREVSPRFWHTLLEIDRMKREGDWK